VGVVGSRIWKQEMEDLEGGVGRSWKQEIEAGFGGFGGSSRK
jgi:hypothetical protein